MPGADGSARPPADTLVAVVAPLAPTAELSRMAAGINIVENEEEEDDVERFRCRGWPYAAITYTLYYSHYTPYSHYTT